MFCFGGPFLGAQFVGGKGATTGSKASCWSSQWAKRCTPTYDRYGVTWTSAPPAAVRHATWRGRPLRRLRRHVARHRLRWRTLTASALCLWATLSSSARVGHSGSSCSNCHSRALSIALSFLPVQKGGCASSVGVCLPGAMCMTESSLTSLEDEVSTFALRGQWPFLS